MKFLDVASSVEMYLTFNDIWSGYFLTGRIV
jgi:hypothetical protein